MKSDSKEFYNSACSDSKHSDFFFLRGGIQRLVFSPVFSNDKFISLNKLYVCIFIMNFILGLIFLFC